MEERKTLTKKDVRKHYWYYFLISEVAISYERLQSLGYCTALIPVLKKLYPDKEDMKSALRRHLVFFNTEAVWGGVINGVTLALEEQKANGEDIPDEAITGMKTGLMGPLAGIGDSIDWATLKPIIFGLSAALSAQGSVLGAFVILLFPLLQFIIGTFLCDYGYKLGKESIRNILSSGWINELIVGAGTLGLFMMGCLSSTYVNLTTPIKFSLGADNTFVLQEMLDSILPGLLPLAVTFGIYWWLSKKNQNFTVIMLLILALAIGGSIIGIF
ncbi:PTS system mannose/fructose/sorbose family transporter subunit IID [Enterococcus pallens]|uniref:PTS system mannose/fructose/sorbose-specific IID component n=1 Tax=Enterococcus pallens ATCC BAA-351 TaxID=1158607 RepID=R2PZ90_9ENTE|nr:PTS system mannose/fructose/sorbose family transporter subunit IID [Enterococcus pallens]EOH88433.1 hypothetical protein UAU_04251 [Enterococcus pallens ATCC BAA-351]EOU17614.1 hypothetical protein I588_02600 [Enterococcus pallens ATCC BAA-351]OJG81487.1 hypothetical protein RV10_GL002726 [Enterococcus pallens]